MGRFITGTLVTGTLFAALMFVTFLPILSAFALTSDVAVLPKEEIIKLSGVPNTFPRRTVATKPKWSLPSSVFVINALHSQADSHID